MKESRLGVSSCLKGIKELGPSTLRCTRNCLEDAVEETLPRGPSGNLGTLPVDQVPVKLTTASVDIHLRSAEPTLTLPEVTGNPEGGNDKDGKVGLEKVARGTSLLAGWEAERRDSSVELVPILVFAYLEGFKDHLT